MSRPVLALALLAGLGIAMEARAESLDDVNKKLTNPVSDLWSIVFQENNFRVDPGKGEDDRWSTNLLFQPVLPLAITDNWNLVTRPVVPLFVSTPRPDPEPGDPTNIGRSTNFGDTTLLQLVSPNPTLSGNWLLGLGPTWIFPSGGSDDFVSQGKYQVGPAALVGYLSDKWILGGLYQSWWSFSGSGQRPPTAQLNFQPIATYFLPDGWSIGYSGNVLANWKNEHGSDWTIPLGVGVGKVVKLGGKLPVKFAFNVQWMPVRPDLYGQRWNLQLVVTPVLPKLIRGNLVEPGELQFGLPPKEPQP
jgi:hypothetical protein